MTKRKTASTAFLVVALLLAFTAIASATTSTSEGVAYTGAIEATSAEEGEGEEEGGGHILFELSEGSNEDAYCDASIKAEIESHGLGVPIEASVSEATFNCTEGKTVTVSPNGYWKINHLFGQGVLVWEEITVTVSDHFGGPTCTYVPMTAAGWVFSSNSTESTAKILMGLQFRLHSGGPLCDEFARWYGNHIINTPDNLNFDP